jgi:dUTP pyrophosphatase
VILSELRVKKVDSHAMLPTRSHEHDAGWDLYCLSGRLLKSGRIVSFGTGIAVDIPTGYVGLVMDRSGRGRAGLKVFGGVVDSGYHGEVHVMLGLHPDNDPVDILPRERIAQMVVVPIAQFMCIKEVQDFEQSARGKKGFGSTGA